MAKFMTPVIQDNPSGWGPCAVPEQFRDMPYQPFSKGDRLGKVADWTGATYQDKRYTNKYSSQFGGGSQYAYFHEEDETSFQLVDTARTQKTAYQRNRMRFAQRNLRRDKDRRNMLQFNLQTLPKSAKQKERERIRLQKKFQKQFGVRQKWDQKSQKPRDSSVEVRSDWEVKEEMDFPQLMKMRYLEVSEPQDIECCGALEYYDKAFDRITTRNEKPLRSIKRIFHTVTTTDDPVIRKLAKTQGNVFATDAILATLMSCTRSVYSWDIVVQRVGSKLFFDKRDNSDFVRAVHRLLEHRHHGLAWPSTERPITQLTNSIIRRVNEASGLYQMFSVLADVILLKENATAFEYLQEFPMQMLAQLETLTGRKARYGLFVINMEYGKNYSGPDKDVFFYDRSVGHMKDAWQSNFLHPVIYYYRHLPTEQEVRFRPADWLLPRPTAIHHIVEDFLTDWTAPVGHILPLRRFLENCLDTDLRNFYAESCFLFALTRQKLPPFCQQGYLRMQGLVGTEPLRQHGVESGLLRDFTPTGQQPGHQGPAAHPQAPGPTVQHIDNKKHEL
ncbi:eukaryotic translation initiation factor 3 subunit D [Orycteropus afer afer]|uniref:Eukaryotic translation initiation factor 3 subunit D n=1 Tax=Orycteropus afer afer TaxID=1230840 RepID=A0AC54ZFI1_ORYAF|nr:eukaryotic translation initiation factor 3 subunit D [Orycteropus afer afer]